MTVTMRYEAKGRGGHPATVIGGLAPLGDAKIGELASALKRLCGVGGSAGAGGTILLQGDQRDRVEAELVKRGYKVKRTGG